MSKSFLGTVCVGAGHPLLVDSVVRLKLERAILAANPLLFRTILQRFCPGITADRRLYGVLVRTTNGIAPVVVDEQGEPLQPGSCLAQRTPIEFLNVEFGPDEIRAVIGDEVWRVPRDRKAGQSGDGKPADHA